MPVLKTSLPVLRMLVLSNYDTKKCRYPKILVLKIPILNMPVLENTDTKNGSTKKRHYLVTPLRNDYFLVGGLVQPPDNIQPQSNLFQKSDSHEKERI